MNAAESPGGVSFATIPGVLTPVATTGSAGARDTTMPLSLFPTASPVSSGGRFTTSTTSTVPSQPTEPGPSPPAEASGAMNRTTIITLSTVLSVVFVLLAAVILFAFRFRQKRFPFRPRGSSPIDDDEIETWRGSGAPPEKGGAGAYAGPTTWTTVTAGQVPSGHARHVSNTSNRAVSSVIVYRNADPRTSRLSSEQTTRSLASVAGGGGGLGLSGYGRASADNDVTSPTLARAPNSRAGLTDEAVPGDPSFIATPKRAAARLSKLPPSSSRSRHSRTHSSRSSTSLRSIVHGGSELEFQLSPRGSSDFPSSVKTRSRIYSSSSVPPRLSFGDDFMGGGGLSPRPLLRDSAGRAPG